MPSKGKNPYSLLIPSAGDSSQGRRDKANAHSELQDIVSILTGKNPQFGFTYVVATQVIIFKCSHPGKFPYEVNRTLWAYKNGKWDNIIADVLAKHRAHCPELRRRKLPDIRIDLIRVLQCGLPALRLDGQGEVQFISPAPACDLLSLVTPDDPDIEIGETEAPEHSPQCGVMHCEISFRAHLPADLLDVTLASIFFVMLKITHA